MAGFTDPFRIGRAQSSAPSLQVPQPTVPPYGSGAARRTMSPPRAAFHGPNGITPPVSPRIAAAATAFGGTTRRDREDRRSARHEQEHEEQQFEQGGFQERVRDWVARLLQQERNGRALSQDCVSLRENVDRQIQVSTSKLEELEDRIATLEDPSLVRRSC